MAHGGSRPNAGRKKGSLNARTQKVAERCAEEGITPLEYMLNIMRDPTQEFDTRMDAAKSAAPYIHPKLASVEQKVEAEVNGSIYEWLTRSVADAGQSMVTEPDDVCGTDAGSDSGKMASGSTDGTMH
tara:strand:- start:1030 stop:1413 length:384 start_codon:yes stop_codon:yes gene_type:complete